MAVVFKRREPLPITTSTLYNSDCRLVLRELGTNSIDSIVCDPPYELISNDGKGFMSNHWDSTGVAFDTLMWSECLRVLKPGGALLAFSAPRTYHRMACALEDAGFEIRDQIMWLYSCLDTKTEIATIEGVKPYTKTKVGDLVLCYNIHTKEYDYQPILEIMEYAHEDTAYRLIGDFGEQVVTGRHRVIVEQDGRESFKFAETLEHEVRVPILESLPDLQQALHVFNQSAGNSEYNLRHCMHKLGNWKRAVREATLPRETETHDCELCGLREGDTEKKCVAQENRKTRVQLCLQWAIKVTDFVGKSLQWGVSRTLRRGEEVHFSENVWRKQSPVEGWGGIPEISWVPSIGESVQKYFSPYRVFPYGESRWLYTGVPANGCQSSWTVFNLKGSSTPYKSRSPGQPTGEPYVVPLKLRSQKVRAWAGHKTTVVRVVPFKYTGKVWCVRVATGAFVAVRDGVAFPTGNSGMPKSLALDKSVEKKSGIDIASMMPDMEKRRVALGIKLSDISPHFSKSGKPTNVVRCWETGYGTPSPSQFNRLCDFLQCPERKIPEAELKVVGYKEGTASTQHFKPNADHSTRIQVPIHEYQTEEAKKLAGWGTQLSPAHEPIVLARKPLDSGTTIQRLSANVLRHGTGGLNLGECKLENGNLPSNVIVSDEDQEIEEAFNLFRKDSMKFFYSAKATKDERNLYMPKGAVNNHPTVKPFALMRYLCKLVTPKYGVVLDPFMGSGSTGLAAFLEGFKFVGVEKDKTYFQIAETRIMRQWVVSQ